jgi:hypothetical protein
VEPATSTEQFEMITVAAALNALRYVSPQMLIFFQKSFRDNIIHDEPAGYIGFRSKLRWQTNKKLFTL